jgi:VWFA-related protein
MTSLLLATSAAAFLLTADKAPLQFAAETETVSIDVAVSDGERPVQGLLSSNFEVKDDGVPQKVWVVSRDEQSVHVVLVLDLSDSLKPKEKQQLRDAAAGFLGRLRPRDRATLVTFTHEIQLISGPGEPAAIRATLDNLDALGSTALFDGVFAGIAIASAAPGRPFVVVFSDGLDVCSWLDSDLVLRAAKHAEATVHHVNPKVPRPDTPKKQPLDTVLGEVPAGPVPLLSGPRRTLAEIVRETGGRTWSGEFGPALEDSFERILSEAQNRYLLMYEPELPQRPGWHKLEVKLKKASGKVRARRGYFAAPTD